VAYVVLEPGSGDQPRELDPAALREQCRGRLPGYMIPSAFAALDELPLTPNGKLDRRALQALGQVAAAGGGGDFVAPESETELALAAIWGELLGLERIGTLDNFFDLGGHSLLSVQVTARVRDRLGVRITPRDLMLQSLGQLASVLEERAARDAALEDERHTPGRRLVDALSGIFRRRRD
jgi:acyl carrier protein